VDALLGVDVGTKRIGLAVATAGVATPVGVIDRTGDDEHDAAAIKPEAHERGVTAVVVGLPIKMDGTRGPAVEAAEQFAAALESAGLRVVMWDERLSTKEAERVLIAGGTRRADRRKVVDKLAATVILQSYLDARPRG
jgi:putative Holliday junction resolvase